MSLSMKAALQSAPFFITARKYPMAARARARAHSRFDKDGEPCSQAVALRSLTASQAFERCRGAKSGEAERR